MRKRMILFVFVCLTLYCSSGKEPIKIGVLLPLSGDFSTYGIMGCNGAVLAAKEINSQGGILGRKVELIIEDNQTDPNLSIQLARKLIQQDNVIAILGPVSSTALYNLKKIAEEYQIPLFYGIDYEGGLFSRYLFCYSPVPDQMIKPLIPYLMEKGGNRFFIYGYDYVWPHKVSEVIEKEVLNLGGEIVGIEFSYFGKRDYSEVIERIFQRKAETLILINPGLDGIKFIEEIHNHPRRNEWKIVSIAADETYLQMTQPDKLEGIITSSHFISSLDQDEAIEFVNKHRLEFGDSVKVTFSTEAHYGLMMFIKAAIEKSGNLNIENIIDALPGTDLIVGNGKIHMNSNHHVSLNMLIAEFYQNDLVKIKDVGLVHPYPQNP